MQTGQKGQFVYVVKADQTAEERPVTIGITYQGETVVQSGLKAGETVVTDGQLRLAPGVAVSVKTSLQPAPVPAPESARPIVRIPRRPAWRNLSRTAASAS